MTADEHERAGRELSRVAAAITAAGAVADPGLVDALLTMIGILVRINDEHTPERKGRCRACGRRAGCPAVLLSSI
jgi:hypothetical protein